MEIISKTKTKLYCDVPNGSVFKIGKDGRYYLKTDCDKTIVDLKDGLLFNTEDLCFNEHTEVKVINCKLMIE